MQVEKAREALCQLERMAVEHLAWLMRVHAALMFPRQAGAIGEPPLPDPRPQGEEMLAVLRARAVMRDRARHLLAHDGADPDVYRAFMAAVDAYGHEARRAEAHYRRLLLETDPLTGVWNRQGMMRDLQREGTRAERTGRSACLAMADIDHFKQVNDAYGHAAGDRVLCQAARFFQRQLRPYDMLYRYGGEEFLFCLPDTDCATACGVLDRLRRHLSRLPVVLDDGTRLTVTCSIGVAELAPGVAVEEAINAADRALYRAKERGRDRLDASA